MYRKSFFKNYLMKLTDFGFIHSNIVYSYIVIYIHILYILVLYKIIILVYAFKKNFNYSLNFY